MTMPDNTEAKEAHMTTDHDNAPDPLEAAIAERDRWLRLNPRDKDGDRIFLGALVHYTLDREWPWTTKRWGIATALQENDTYGLSVRVTNIDSNSEWTCEPGHLSLLSSHVTV